MGKPSFLELALGIVLFLSGSILTFIGLAFLLGPKRDGQSLAYPLLVFGPLLSIGGIAVVIRWASALVPK